MKRAIVTLCTVMLAGVAGLADTLAAHRPQQDKQRQKGPIRVQTNLVSILANVTDAKGEPVIGLAQSAFQLFEEVIELKIERDAALHFVQEVVRPGDRLAVFSFTSDVIQLCNFSDDPRLLEAAVRRVDPGADMGTSLYDAVVLGSQSVKRQGADRRRALVIITDAGETTSYWKFDDARRAAVASDALLYTVVVRPMKSDAGWNTAGEHAIETITDSTGGAMFYPTDLSELTGIFDQINRELRTQYLLGYYPTPTPPAGSSRHVAVKVNTGDNVRYRKEYLTAGAAQ